MYYILKTKDKIEKMVDTARKQGKSEKEIRLLINIAIDEMLKNVKAKDIF